MFKASIKSIKIKISAIKIEQNAHITAFFFQGSECRRRCGKWALGRDAQQNGT